MAEHYLRGMDAVTITKAKAVRMEDIEEVATIKAAQMVLQLQGYDVDPEKLKAAIIRRRVELAGSLGWAKSKRRVVDTLKAFNSLVGPSSLRHWAQHVKLLGSLPSLDPQYAQANL